MAGWNDLPKELKWMILKYVIMECSNRYSRTSDAIIKYYYASFNTTRIIYPNCLFMSDLLLLLSQIDKQTRNLLKSKTCYGEKKYFFRLRI